MEKNNFQTTSWNVKGIIVEGVAGSGKSSAIRAILDSEVWRKKNHISSIVLSEHQTQRVLEAREKTGDLRKEDHFTLLSDIVGMIEKYQQRLGQMDWASRNREAQKLPFLLERFHFSHVFHYPGMTWEDVAGIDQRLSALDTKVCVLSIDADVMFERIVKDYRKNGFQNYIRQFGNNDKEIVLHFQKQQEKLFELVKRSVLPIQIINTSSKSPQKTADEILEFWGF